MGSFTESNADALRKVQELLRAQKNERTMRRQSIQQQERPSNTAYNVVAMDTAATATASPRNDRHNQQVIEKCRSLSDRLAHLSESLQAVSTLIQGFTLMMLHTDIIIL